MPSKSVGRRRSCRHADWISRSITELLDEYQKLQDQDRGYEAESEALKNALKFAYRRQHRQKRKVLLEKRDQLAEQMKAIAANAQKGQQAMQQLLQSVEARSGLLLTRRR